MAWAGDSRAIMLTKRVQLGGDWAPFASMSSPAPRTRQYEAYNSKLSSLGEGTAHRCFSPVFGSC